MQPLAKKMVFTTKEGSLYVSPLNITQAKEHAPRVIFKPSEPGLDTWECTVPLLIPPGSAHRCKNLKKEIPPPKKVPCKKAGVGLAPWPCAWEYFHFCPICLRKSQRKRTFFNPQVWNTPLARKMGCLEGFLCALLRWPGTWLSGFVLDPVTMGVRHLNGI